MTLLLIFESLKVTEILLDAQLLLRKYSLLVLIGSWTAEGLIKPLKLYLRKQTLESLT